MWQSQKVKIEKTNDIDVGCALAYLSGFRKGTLVSKINNIYHRELNSKCVVVFHKETLEEAGDDHPMAYVGPDFVVIQIYRPPKENEIEWQPTDEYLIEFNERVDISNIGKLEKEIRTAYSEKREKH